MTSRPRSKRGSSFRRISSGSAEFPFHRKVFVAVAGNIGSGKSSLTRLLSLQFGWKPYLESVDNNPYLNDFYGDMKRWSFNLQVYFLSSRFRSYKAIIEGKESVILDRVIYEDGEIFARNLYEIGRMDERDYANYTDLYHMMTAYLRPPDLLIYLRANVDTLLKQIALRGRDFEQSIRRDYLEELNGHYESWIKRYTLGPMIALESDALDFVNSRQDLETVVSMITRALSSPRKRPGLPKRRTS